MDFAIKILLIVALLVFVFLAINIVSLVSSLKDFLSRSGAILDKAQKDLNEVKNSAISSLEEVKTISPKVDKAILILEELKGEAQVTLQKTQETNSKAVETLANIDLAAENFSKLAVTAEFEIAKAGKIIDPVRDAVKKLTDKITEPLEQTANIVSSVTKGVGNLIDRFRSK